MSNSAHSLLELLVVIALSAILAAVCVWGYAYYTEQAKIAADEDYVAQVHHLIEVEHHGEVGAIWINISDGSLAAASFGLESDPVQDSTPAELGMKIRPLQSNTYAQGGAQYLTYDGGAFRTACGNPEDLAILWAIYQSLGGTGVIYIVTRFGAVDAVSRAGDHFTDIDLPDSIRRIRLSADEYQNTTLTSADGFTWQAL